MASNIDILLDKSGGLLLGGSAPAGVLPDFTRNDVYPFRIRVLERNADGSYTDANLSSPSFSLGIGNIDAVATDGQFKLTTTTGTSTAISFNATTAQVLSAVSAIAGNVSVATYGDSGSAWIITAATPNTALSFGALPFTLFPTAAVQVNTRRVPTASINAQQIISLSRNPAVFSDSFASVSGVGVALTKIQDGSASLNETYALTIGNDVYGGSYSLAYGGYSVGIGFNQTAINVTTILSAITGIGTGNISVVSDSKRGLIISFVNSLGLQNVSTPLTLDSSGVQVYNWYSATVTMSTSEMEELFNEAGTDTITPTLEIEMTESGQTKTLLQYMTSISKDLILTGASVPANLALYYTKAQVDAGFVEDSSSNVDATNRKLYNSTGSVFLDWQNNTIGTGTTILDLSGTAVTITDGYNLGVGTTTGTKIGVSTSSKLAFFGSTPITQPASPNVVTNLVNLGLLHSGSTTYGVFPLSSRTLTTTASIYFGTVGSNSTNSVSVVVTGCQINDIVLIGLPASNPNGLSFNGHATTTNGLEVDCINATNGNITPATATYRITVIGY
jgi:hypothetical protein